jgi:beta-lactamase superfamily II metal-dependent hydrolase
MKRPWFLVLAFAFWFAASLSAQQLEIRFLDVGQGDAVLIREGGKNVLVDAGGSARIATYLQSFDIDTIDLVVASHNHADHIGGMTAVFQSAVVRFYLDNGVPATTATYQRTMSAVTSSGAQYLRATARTITLGTATIQIIPPPAGNDQNNSSVGVLVEFGEFHALLTGDSELKELRSWLAEGSIRRVNVVKVAHHGSNNGSSGEWVNATRPQVAVISVGAGNSYGHPSPGAIAGWEASGARVYRTDRDGGVLVLANDDGSFVVTTDRSDPKGVVQFRPFVQDDRGAAQATPAVAPSCCRVCTRGKACGNSCINAANQCHQPPGCACNAKP